MLVSIVLFLQCFDTVWWQKTCKKSCTSNWHKFFGRPVETRRYLEKCPVKSRK